MISLSDPCVGAGDFYQAALDLLSAGGIECLVAGAFALRAYTGIERDTKDFDLMLRPRDVAAALEVFRRAGLRADYAFSHWLAKVHFGEYFIDLIYRAGNGLCEVDDSWFNHGHATELFARTVALCPPEEIIWQKAYIMERERFDGADILHLVRHSAASLDWKRLMERFGPDYRVLLSHLIVFGFVYPTERECIPRSVMEHLLQKLWQELGSNESGERVCRGTFLSRAQYLADVERWGYADARLAGRAAITAEELAHWTNAIDRDERPK